MANAEHRLNLTYSVFVPNAADGIVSNVSSSSLQSISSVSQEAPRIIAGQAFK